MNKTILIIEDNRLNYKLLADFLGVHGYVTKHLVSGLDVVSFVQEWKPFLILLDIQLPDISGFEVMELLKKDPLSATVPVIAVTACVHAEEQHLAKSKGFHGYMTKPVDMNAMLGIVQSFAKQGVAHHQGIIL
ncbi:MAG: response regulator [Alphaproteobacteria bacterium]